MIFVALGANLPSRFGPPADTLDEALRVFPRRGIRVIDRSRWWKTAPVPVSDQPWYVNGVAAVQTRLTPQALLDALHAIEEEFGRVRSERNAPRLIDLDLIAYDDQVSDCGLMLPHPRFHERAFVLVPLREIAPGWFHPRSGKRVEQMLAELPPGQAIEPA